MTTYPWVILSAVLVVTPVVTATAAPPTQQIVDEFVLHKRQGDKFRLDGRLSDALSSYEKALAIRYDPTVAGRTGLVLNALGNFSAAAYQLHRAVNDTSTSLSKQDRLDFSRAYSDALLKVCRVDINVDHVGARVEIDGIESNQGRADFWLFLEPGKHVIRAQLQGFLDTLETIETVSGPQRKVALVMQPLLDVMPSAVVTTRPIDLSRTVRSWPSLYADKPPPNLYKTSTSGRFVLGFGAWIPFGATPGVGIGGQLHGGWRSKSWWEIGIEARAAWTLGTENFAFGSVYTWAVSPALCGRSRVQFFGCLLVQVDGGGFDTNKSWTLFGAGLRAGYEFHLINRFYVALFVDATVRSKSPTIGRNATPGWAGNRVIPTLGANVLTFF